MNEVHAGALSLAVFVVVVVLLAYFLGTRRGRMQERHEQTRRRIERTADAIRSQWSPSTPPEVWRG